MSAIVHIKSVFATYHLYMSNLLLFFIHLILSYFEISAAIILHWMLDVKLLEVKSQWRIQDRRAFLPPPRFEKKITGLFLYILTV